MHSFSNNQIILKKKNKTRNSHLLFKYLNKIKCVMSLIYIFLHAGVAKKNEIAELYWEAIDFILQAEYINLKKHKFV